MHTGLSTIFQSAGGLSDPAVFEQEVRLADMAEGLGFDSLWGVEHHFTDYTMCPDVLQFLTYMAGRTQRIQLGSMVVVLPWHDPVRVAEQVSMLDVLSGGRAILGVGRGLGKVEFDGFRVPMEESRPRFLEAAEIVISGLEQGFVKYDGEYYSVPRRDIRPAPLRSFRGRTYAAAVSPESSRIMAELGLGILVIPQKPWDTMTADLAAYREIFREVNGEEAPPPVVASWVFCDPDPGRAEELGLRHIGAYYQSVLDHYGLAGEHLKTQKGYEYYGALATQLQTIDDSGIRLFADLQTYGTPKECLEKIRHVRSLIGNETFVAVCSYAGMPYDEAERNLRCFATEIMPEVKKM